MDETCCYPYDRERKAHQTLTNTGHHANEAHVHLSRHRKLSLSYAAYRRLVSISIYHHDRSQDTLFLPHRHVRGIYDREPSWQ